MAVTSLTDDTIVAIATAPQGAYRGVVRLSGPDLKSVLQTLGVEPKLLQSASERPPALHSIAITLEEPFGQVPMELLYWPSDRSYTRQPTAELHTFGAPPLLATLQQHVCNSGARLAQPGEFTLRAFLAGRLDLVQAEAVLGTIDASDQSQLQVALAQMAGGLSTPLAELRQQLLTLLAHLEAGLDFVEEDIEFISTEQLLGQIDTARAQLTQAAGSMRTRDRTDQPPRVVIVGRANAGKSSLFNLLCGDDAALVSNVAGTTSDYVTRRVSWQGLALLLVDTAGAEDHYDDHSLAAAAQLASTDQASQADLALHCFDVTTLARNTQGQLDPPLSWEDQEHATALQLGVLTKIDQLATGQQSPDLPKQSTPPIEWIATSSSTGEGVDTLRQAVVLTLQRDLTEHSAVAATAARCSRSLTQANEALEQARLGVLEHRGEEIIADEIRLTLEHLGLVVGAIVTDDLLDQIFSQFCVGK